MAGYRLAISSHGFKDEHQLTTPPDFHDWVAYRTHFKESTTGWCAMILETTKNEEEAFDRFFELIDEHNKRTPTIIARFHTGQSEHSSHLNVALVTYTEDPGFFVVSNIEGDLYQFGRFLPSLDWFETFVSSEIDAMEIIDEDRFRKLKLSRG